MKILKFSAENIKGIKVVDITPTGDIVTLSGPNGAGKSSVLDTIEALLVGGDLPLKNGEAKGKAEIDLGEFIVSRVKTEKTDTLKVKNKEGAQYPSPREFLSKFIGQLSIDPLAFIRLKEKDQLDIIFKMNPDLKTGLEEKEKAIAKLKEDRSIILKDGQRLKFELEKMVFDPKLPIETVDLKDLFEERKKAMANNEAISFKIDERDKIIENIQAEESGQKENEQAIEKLRLKIKDLESLINKSKLNVTAHKEKQEKLDEFIASTKEINLSEIEQKISTNEETNKKISINNSYKVKVKEKDNLAASYTAKGIEIETCEKSKTELLTKSNLPLAGLSILNGTLVYNGVSVSSLSTAEKVRVGASMAVSQNPKAKIILVDDASLLDEANLKILHEICSDFQIWQVVNDTSKNKGFYIEAGEITNKELNNG